MVRGSRGARLAWGAARSRSRCAVEGGLPQSGNLSAHGGWMRVCISAFRKRCGHGGAPARVGRGSRGVRSRCAGEAGFRKAEIFPRMGGGCGFVFPLFGNAAGMGVRRLAWGAARVGPGSRWGAGATGRGGLAASARRPVAQRGRGRRERDKSRGSRGERPPSCRGNGPRRAQRGRGRRERDRSRGSRGELPPSCRATRSPRAPGDVFSLRKPSGRAALHGEQRSTGALATCCSVPLRSSRICANSRSARGLQ
jgi:hypothetical protein